MYSVFSNCSSLKKLPDISKWNTGKCKDMSCMFENCISLIAMPNISKWDVHNVEKINKMFHKCSSLIFLPDIDNWNYKEIKADNDSLQFAYPSSSEKENINLSIETNKSLINSVNDSSTINIRVNNNTYINLFDFNNEENNNINNEYYNNFYL